MSSGLLVFDDNPDVVEFIGRVAGDSDFDVFSASTPDAFWTAYGDMGAGSIVLDLELVETNGIAILKELAERNCNAPILLISGYHEEILRSAARLGGKDGLDMRGTLRKPFDVDDLSHQLQNLR